MVPEEREAVLINTGAVTEESPLDLSVMAFT